MVFDNRGGSIGRLESNDWVLPDPEKFISGRHASIECLDGVYMLKDTSVNGVFVNHSPEPLGKGNQVELANGDSLVIGNYEIDVRIDETAGFPAESRGDYPAFEGAAAVDHGTDDLMPESSEFTDFINELGPADGDAPAGVDARQKRNDELDPFAPSPDTDNRDILNNLLDEKDPLAQLSEQQDVQPDHLPSVESHYVPPSVSDDIIPPDWDKTGIHLAEGDEKPAEGPGQEPSMDRSAWQVPPAPPGIVDEYKIPEDAPGLIQRETPERGGADQPARATAQSRKPQEPQGGYAADHALLDAFLRGAALESSLIRQESDLVLMENLGKIFREVVEGMMEILAARANLKSEFRITHTVVQPRHNNPLKFSIGVDEAMENLLFKRGTGYMPPLESIQEAFRDLKDHQLAMLSGMKAMHEILIKRFDPQNLEEKQGEHSKLGGLLPAGRKARNWDQYVEMYGKLMEDFEDDFQKAFGDVFGQAYDQQIRKLSSMRKKSGG